jgi:hypothetical protein
VGVIFLIGLIGMIILNFLLVGAAWAINKHPQAVRRHYSGPATFMMHMVIVNPGPAMREVNLAMLRVTATFINTFLFQELFRWLSHSSLVGKIIIFISTSFPRAARGAHHTNSSIAFLKYISNK